MGMVLVEYLRGRIMRFRLHNRIAANLIFCPLRSRRICRADDSNWAAGPLAGSLDTATLRRIFPVLPKQAAEPGLAACTDRFSSREPQDKNRVGGEEADNLGEARPEPAFNFQIAYLAFQPTASASRDRLRPRSSRNRCRRGGLLSNDGEKHHDLCRWICCGRSYYQS